MIRIGIVGCGRILAAHLRGYRMLRAAGVDDFRITALCPRKADDGWMYVKRGSGPPQRKPVSDIPGDPLAVGDEYLSDFQPDTEVSVFTDFREMIASGQIDAVNDFSLHGLHHQVAQACFARGQHLLSQKPLAVTVAAAKRMCEQADAAGCTFGVFENFRNSPQTRHLQWALGRTNEPGPLGKLQMILLGYIAAWWAPNRIVAETPWRHDKLEGGGIALDLGVHFLDQMRALAGEPASVLAETSVIEPTRVLQLPSGAIQKQIDCDADDTFFGQVRFKEGCLANMAASWAGRGPATKVGQGTVFYAENGHVTGNQVTFADGRTCNLDELYRAEATPALQAKHFPLGITDSFALNQYDWLQAIRERRQPETSGDEGLRDLAAAYAILESHLAGRRVDVDDVLSGREAAYQAPLNERFGIR